MKKQKIIVDESDSDKSKSEEDCVLIDEKDENDDKQVKSKKKCVNLDESCSDEQWFQKIKEEEKTYLLDNVMPEVILEDMDFICTTCMEPIAHLKTGRVQRHPLLGVPVCRKCKNFYFSGEWTKGDDGTYDHCRWCANGGDLLLCDKCPNAFCKKCIKRNLGRKKVTEIEEKDEWLCIACDPTQIFKQRAAYYSVHHYFQNSSQREEKKRIEKEQLKKAQFVDHSFQDALDCCNMMHQNIKGAKGKWDKKKTQKSEAEMKKAVKTIRKVFRVTSYNMSLLENNLMDQMSKVFPSISANDLEPDTEEIPDIDNIKAEVKVENNHINEDSQENEMTIVNHEIVADSQDSNDEMKKPNGAEKEEEIITDKKSGSKSERKNDSKEKKELSKSDKKSTAKKDDAVNEEVVQVESDLDEEQENDNNHDESGNENGKDKESGEDHENVTKEDLDSSAEDQDTNKNNKQIKNEIIKRNEETEKSDSDDESNEKKRTKSSKSIKKAKKTKEVVEVESDSDERTKTKQKQINKTKNAIADVPSDEEIDADKSDKNSDEEKVVDMSDNSSDEKVAEKSDNCSDEEKVADKSDNSSDEKVAELSNKGSDEEKVADKNDEGSDEEKAADQSDNDSDEEKVADKTDEKVADKSDNSSDEEKVANKNDKSSDEEKSADKNDKSSDKEKSADKSDNSYEKKEKIDKRSEKEILKSKEKSKTKQSKQTARSDAKDKKVTHVSDTDSDNNIDKENEASGSDNPKDKDVGKEKAPETNSDEDNSKEEDSPKSDNEKSPVLKSKKSRIKSLKDHKKRSKSTKGSDLSDEEKSVAKPKTGILKNLQDFLKDNCDKSKSSSESGAQSDDGAKRNKKGGQKNAHPKDETVESEDNELKDKCKNKSSENESDASVKKHNEKDSKDCKKKSKVSKSKQAKSKEKITDPSEENDSDQQNEEAKKEVLAMSSSEADAPVIILEDDDEVIPKKKLKKKKELDRMRRLSGHTKTISSSDEEDEDDAKKKPSATETVAAVNKRKRVPTSESSGQDSVSPRKEDITFRECKVDITAFSSKLMNVLEEKGKVNVNVLREATLSEGREISRLCNLDSVHAKSDAPTSKKTRKSHAQNVKNVSVEGSRLVDISSEEDMAGLSEADMIPDLHNAEDPIETENVAAKALVLATSSDEGAVSNQDTEIQTQPLDKKKKNGVSKTVDKNGGGGDAPSARPALLCMKLSETDTSDDEVKYRKKMQAKSQSNDVASGSADSDLNTNVAAVGGSKKRKTGKRRHIIDSEEESNDPDFKDDDSDDDDDIQEVDSDDSDVQTKKKPKRRKGKQSDDSSDGSDSEDARPKKRRRIKVNSDSNSDNDEENQSKVGRHNIRKVIKDKHLADETKTAAAEERERRKRVEERQAFYNKMFKLPDNKDGTLEELVLDFDPDTKKALVEVNKKLVPKLKPHQAKGVKFMWDACFESVAQIQEGKVPGGAILAHCMGLGKTLQTITLTHTLMENRKTKIDRVMVICPVNTVKNWEDEYEKWLKGDLELEVYGMTTDKDNWARADKLHAWFREGGVLIIGYDLFRNLTNEANKKFKSKHRKIFNECLLDPGPDVVVCDEGHLLKNEKSAINKAVNRIKTLRRIILTGTPLQNNLKEYYEMVNFVKPLLLGTRKEFMNRFVNPIINGQHSDSTDRDIRTMKKRSFILNDLLKGCMQRLDYNVLVPYLQPKLEFVVSINMTDLQKRLYKFYLENYAKAGQVGLDGKLEGGKKGGLFYDVQSLSKIWNHPFILQLAQDRKLEKEDDDDEEGSLKDFIDDGSDDDAYDSAVSNSEEEAAAPKSRRTRQNAGTDELAEGLDSDMPTSSRGWWNQLLKDDEQLDKIEYGSKMVLLVDILKECELIGDKVLVFSQSLRTLDLIEEFLANIHAQNERNESLPVGEIGTWVQGMDYYRLDGSTDANTRKVWCKFFNKNTHHRMRLFLISTRAGGLGINLVGANRVILFDASWNPSHDVQSIFRVYRFGQTKPVYIYRFLAKGTMEEKIYDRQVTKQSLAARVVDEQQIERHFTMNELSELYEFVDEPLSAKPLPAVPEDRLLADLVDKHKETIWKFHHHDSLLENKVDENLTEAERKSAWEEFENEKKGFVQTNVGIENINAFGAMLQGMLPMSGDGRVMASPINPMAIQMQLKAMNPELSHEELVNRTRGAILQLQNLHRTQTPVIMNQNTLGVGHRQGPGYDQSYYQQEMAKAKAMINKQYPGMYRGGVGPGGSGMPQMIAPKGMMMRPQAPMFARAEPEEITIEDDNDVPIVVPQQRVVPRAVARVGMRGGRGARRGRPRLDPDTDLDFSPEPSSISTQQVIAKLKAQGMTVNKTSDDS